MSETSLVPDIPPRKINWLPYAIDALALVIILGLAFWKFNQLDQSSLPEPLHGEWWGNHSFSDFLSLMGGKHFFEEGFLQNYLTANISVGTEPFARGWQYYVFPQLVPNSAVYYTHYGSLDAILAGILMNFGLSHLTQFYQVFAALSFVGLGLWYITASLAFSRLVGLISTAIIGTSAFFLSSAESVSAEPLALQLAFASAFFFILAQRVFKSNAWRVTAYVFTWSAGFLAANNNPQFLLFMAAFIGGYLWINNPHTRASLRLFLLLISGIAAGAVVHLALNAWALGGVQNMFTDLVAVLLRRTVGYDAVNPVSQWVYQGVGYIGLIETRMWDYFHLEFAGLILLCILVLWLISRLEKTGYTTDGLKKQWQLTMLMLGGGAVFILIFMEAAAAQPLDILKVMLPGAAVMTGLAIVTLARYLSRRGDPWPNKAILGIFIVAVLAPVFQQAAAGFPFRDDFYRSENHLGGSPEQVRAVAGFIKDNTLPGDVVFTNINTGESNQVSYPHPAWEFLSGRRIEVFDTLDMASASLQKLEQMRTSLKEDNPGRNVSFYLLLSRHQQHSALGDLVSLSGIKLATYDSHQWWTQKHGYDPWPDDRRLYDLFHLDPAKWDTLRKALPAGRSVEPNPNVPWTETLSMTKPPGVDTSGWSNTLPRFSYFTNPGTLYLSSYESVVSNLSHFAPGFDSRRGGTAEIRLRMIEASPDGLDGAMFSIADGARELKVVFRPEGIELHDRSGLILVHRIEAYDSFHVYRLTISGEIGRFFIDDAQLVAIKLAPAPSRLSILFGDYSPLASEGITCELDYLAYSNRGAFAPDGSRLPAVLTAEDARRWGLNPEKLLTKPYSAADIAIPWTRIYHMDGAGNDEARRTLLSGLPSGSYMLVNGRLIFSTREIPAGNLVFRDESADNTLGSTAEVRLWVPQTARDNRDAAMLSLQDGRHELKLAFFADVIEVYDSNLHRGTIPVSTREGFHTYRLTLIGDTGRVYVDQKLAAAVTLEQDVTGKGLLLGDFAPARDEFISAAIEYIAYSSRGAFSPSGGSPGKSLSVEDQFYQSKASIQRFIGLGHDITPLITAGPTKPDTTTIWTRIFSMDGAGNDETRRTLLSGLPSGSYMLVNGRLIFSTRDIPAGNLVYRDESADNTLGSTAEVRMWVPQTARDNRDAAMLSLQDGKHELKLAFFADGIEVYDSNLHLGTIPVSPREGFHTYRLAIVGDIGRIYIDQSLAAAFTLEQDVTGKGLLLGDFAPARDEFISAAIEYIAYSSRGAFSPSGESIGIGR